MKRCLPLAAALALSAATALAAAPSAGQDVRVQLAPGKVHEECLRMEAGEKRRWHWRADGPVDFNIHYHRGKDVFYPVKREGMRGDGGTFTATSAEDYCWMWTARKDAVSIEGGITK